MNVWTAFVGSIVRWILTALFAGLVAKGIVDKETAQATADSGAMAITAGVLGLIVPLLWSLYQKVVAKVTVMVAQGTEPPQVSTPKAEAITEALIKRKTGEIPLPEKVSLALSKETVIQ